mgnify:CR=1 FL=1
MNDPDVELTKLVVNLIPEAVAALDEGVVFGDHSRTDGVNRALLIYAPLARVISHGGGWLYMTDGDVHVRIKVQVGRPWFARLAWWR